MYADIFDYPLTAREILRYLIGARASLEEVETCLSTGFLSYSAGFYSLPGREPILSTRQRRAAASRQLWSHARRYGALIARLPFVRMLAVTGSLAMNNTEAGGDIDFLIVTRPGRLWLCRLLVLLVVRLAAWRGVTLCPNYLISQDDLAFSDRNLYSAHEFIQMVPLSGMEIYRQMLALNTWVRDYLPNSNSLPSAFQLAENREPGRFLKALLEALLLTPPGAWLENWEMRRKVRKLSLENAGNPEAVFTTSLCKGHSNRHGWRTQTALRDRLLRRFTVQVDK